MFHFYRIEIYKPSRTRLACIAGMFLSAVFACAQSPALPDAAGRDTVQRVCGACHPATIVLGHGMTREGWGQVIASMITRGAKGTPADFETVTDYLAKNLPPGSSGGGSNAPRRRSSFPAGPRDRQIVDPAAAARGKTTYSADCASCHGPLARGTANAPDLVRSIVILHDRYGDAIGPYLQHSHPASSGTTVASLTANQIRDLSHFLHQQIEDTLRSGPYTKVLNVLTGNAQEGAVYFNGAGGCTSCHSATGDLAGIASKYDPPTLQQRMLFPRNAAPGRRSMTAQKPTTVTVTSDNGESVTGTLVSMDDFNVALRDASGNYHSWLRTPGLKVDRHDPYAAHEELLDKITDADIHNLVAYLETLK